MISNRIDRVVLLGGFAAIALLSYFLYREIAYQHNMNSGKQLGYITYRYRIAQRKFPSTVLWTSIEQNAPIYENDWIRTDNLSEATIFLEDGVRIDLDQNTMIVLQKTEEAMEVDILEGSTLIQKSKESFPPPLFIRSGQRKVAFETGDLRFSKSGNSLHVGGNNGESYILADGEQRRLLAGENALLNESGYKKWDVGISLVAPVDNAHIYTTDSTLEVLFQWNKSEASPLVILEAAGDRAFQHRIARLKTTLDSATMQLPRGMYYWRVRPANDQADDGAYTTRKLNLLEKQAPEQISPIVDARFTYVTYPPHVHFSWAPLDTAKEYILRIREEGDRTIFKERTLKSTRISMTLPAGAYSWQITPVGHQMDSTAPSPFRPFSIIQQKEYEPPNPVFPESRSVISDKKVAEEGIYLRWLMAGELALSELTIAKDPEFKNIIVTQTIGENSYFLKQKLETGKYYWKIQARDRENKSTPESPVSEFRISDQEIPVETPEKEPEITPAAKPSITRPERKPAVVQTEPSRTPLPDPVLGSPVGNQVLDMTNADRIRFRWKRVPGAESYVLKMYHGGKVVFSTKTTAPNFDLTDLSVLDIGQFSWGLIPQASGRPDGNEKKASFRITLKDEPGVITDIETK